MRRAPKWLVWLFGDDRNSFHPTPEPTLKCAKCNRLVTFAEKSLDYNDWLHADDASPICKPVGVYRA